jgi:hypothetical protein
MQAAAALQHATGAMRTPLKSHKVCASISWCTPHIHTVCTHHLLDQPAWYIMHAPACCAMQGAAPLCTTPPLAVESQVQRRAWPPLLYQQNDVRSEVTAKLKHARNPGAAHKLLAARVLQGCAQVGTRSRAARTEAERTWVAYVRHTQKPPEGLCSSILGLVLQLWRHISAAGT